jgi:hypothetical protein
MIGLESIVNRFFARACAAVRKDDTPEKRGVRAKMKRLKDVVLSDRFQNFYKISDNETKEKIIKYVHAADVDYLTTMLPTVAQLKALVADKCELQMVGHPTRTELYALEKVYSQYRRDRNHIARCLYFGHQAPPETDSYYQFEDYTLHAV